MTSTKRTIKSLLFAVLLGLPACSPDDPQEPTAIHHGSIGNEPAAGAAGIAAGGNSTSSGSKTGGSSNATGGKTSITVGGSGNTDVGGTTSASGSSSVGGNADVGGSATVGGASSSIGGASAAGGSTAIGGSSATGGKSSTTGGATGTGGNTGTGGAATGGASTTGTGGGALTCQPLNNPCWQNIMCCSGVCQNSVCVTPGTGGNTGTGGAATGGASSTGGMSATGGKSSTSTGGATGTGGNTGTGGAATGGASVVACTPGLTPTTETAKPFTCTGEFVRNTAFDTMNAARGNDLTEMKDVWKRSDGTTYAVAATASSTFAYQSTDALSDASWSAVSGLPSNFGPQLFRDIEGNLCVGGNVPNTISSNTNAKLLCNKGGVWEEQSAGFCPTGCPSGGLIDVSVKSISSVSRTTVMVVTAFDQAAWDYASQVFVKKQGGSWVRQTLPVTTGLRLNAALVHSDCDAYVVGQYGSDAILLRYNGTDWSIVNGLPSGITAFNSVHENGSELYIGGSTLYADGTNYPVMIFTQNFQTWGVDFGKAKNSQATTVSVIWTPRLGAVLMGTSQELKYVGEQVCEFWYNGTIDTMSQFAFTTSVVMKNAIMIRSIYGDASGSVVMGVDGQADNWPACSHVAAVYTNTCK